MHGQTPRGHPPPAHPRTRAEALIQHAEARAPQEVERHEDRDSLHLWRSGLTPTHPDGGWTCHLFLGRPRGAPPIHASATEPTRDAALSAIRHQIYRLTQEPAA